MLGEILRQKFLISESAVDKEMTTLMAQSLVVETDKAK